MKHRLIFVLTLCLIFAAVTGCKGKKNPIEKLGIISKPKIAKIVETEYEAVNTSGQITKVVPEKIRGIVTSICDEKGRVIEERSSDGSQLFKEYNDKGLLIKETATSSDREGEVVFILSYKYDDKGNKIEYYEAWPPEFIPKLYTIYSYDDENRMISKIDYLFDTQRITNCTYEYPSQDVKIRTDRYGNYTDVRTWRFDSKKRIIEYRFDDLFYELYEYDDNDNWIKMTYGPSPYRITERVITYR